MRKVFVEVIPSQGARLLGPAPHAKFSCTWQAGVNMVPMVSTAGHQALKAALQRATCTLEGNEADGARHTLTPECCSQ